MVKINEVSLGIYHRVTANKNLLGMKMGEMKDVLIQKMSDGRFSVMGLFIWTPEICSMDMFYQIFNNETELHEAFTEQFTNMVGFTKG